ncbi:MAG: hypothetical protein ABSE99_03905 [Terracidiphilus sp.]|jgi:hypothetical protein
MENPYSPDPKILNAVRSPLVFNALIVLVLTGIMGGVLVSGLPNEAKEVALGLYFAGLAAVVIRVDILFRKDPRGLAYGPNEYIEESRLAHERQMEAMKGQRR